MLRIKEGVTPEILSKYGFVPEYSRTNGTIVMYQLEGINKFYFQRRGTDCIIQPLAQKPIKYKLKFLFKKNRPQYREVQEWGLFFTIDKEDLDFYSENWNGGRDIYLFDLIYDLVKDGIIEKCE